MCTACVCVCVASLAHFLSSLSGTHNQWQKRSWHINSNSFQIQNIKKKKPAILDYHYYLLEAIAAVLSLKQENRSPRWAIAQMLTFAVGAHSGRTVHHLWVVCVVSPGPAKAGPRFLSQHPCLPASRQHYRLILPRSVLVFDSYLASRSLSLLLLHIRTKKRKQRADHKLVLLCKHAATLFFRISQSCEL